MFRILFSLAALLLAANAAASDCCKVLEPAALGGLETIVERINEKRVVYVGESHDQYGHHLAQLEVVRRLHEKKPNLAIGLEQFQQPFQEVLDDYVAGRIDEAEMLRESEYFTRWRFDYRLYRPILQFARDNAIPLVALNVPAEVTRKVGKGGVDALDEEARRWIPDRLAAGEAEADHAYRGRLRQIFHMHPDAGERNFDHFVEAQLLWDEGMAERAVGYLNEHPDRRLVVLAGSGHIGYPGAIPERVGELAEGLENFSAAVLVCDAPADSVESGVDFILYPKAAELPAAGLLGIFLDEREGGLFVEELSDDGAAKAVGMRKGDRIAMLEGEEIHALGDLKALMFERKPGEKVTLEVERNRFLLGMQRKRFEVELR